MNKYTDKMESELAMLYSVELLAGRDLMLRPLITRRVYLNILRATKDITDNFERFKMISAMRKDEDVGG